MKDLSTEGWLFSRALRKYLRRPLEQMVEKWQTQETVEMDFEDLPLPLQLKVPVSVRINIRIGRAKCKKERP
jgi:hypothetical protein